MRPTQLAALILPVLVIVLASPAHAARWQAINGKAAALRSEVDGASLQKVGEGSVRLWHREVHRKPYRAESGAFSYTHLTMLSEFQCGKRSTALVQRSYTAADGSELKSEAFDTLDFQPVAPDSPLEGVFAYACQHAAKPPSLEGSSTKTAAAEPAATVGADAPPPASNPNPAASANPARPVPATPAAAPVAPATAKAASKKGGKPEEPPHPAHWSYGGASGPAQWGKLDARYETCASGQRQSPIDIRRTVRADLPAIRFDYRPVPLSIVDNGHSIKVDTANAGGISVDGEDYALQQFHFHRPSEEKIDGKAYALVAHLVHQSSAGKLAVVAVLFEAGKEQALIRTLWNNLPLETDKPVVRADLKINPLELLPAKRGYYTFLGSLTTPPCSEGVLWLVLKTPVQVSKEQLAGFSTIYKNNVRPVQPVNGRLIKESR